MLQPGQRLGLISTGSAICWPITVVAICLSLASPAVCGAKPISSNAAMLSAAVRPFSARPPAPRTRPWAAAAWPAAAPRPPSRTRNSPSSSPPHSFRGEDRSAGPPRSASLDGSAGVDRQLRAGDVPRLVGGQEQDGVRDVQRIDEADPKGFRPANAGSASSSVGFSRSGRKSLYVVSFRVMPGHSQDTRLAGRRQKSSAAQWLRRARARGLPLARERLRSRRRRSHDVADGGQARKVRVVRCRPCRADVPRGMVEP